MMAALAVATLALAGCADIYRNHGYAPPAGDLALVEIGDSREAVAGVIGQPTAEGILDDSGWYYVRSRWRTRGFRAPQEIDREVVAVSFSPAGRVANVERFGLEEGRVVVLSRRTTSSNTEGIGFLRQLLGNIGRFDAAQILNQD
jgi:outer membrane protein assembly factor BamE (lipoprotein component of BamABCDE complex)